MKKPILYIKILINFLFVIAAVLFTFLILPKLLGFFLPFVIGWIVAMIANPLVKFLEKRMRLLRKHSSAIIIIAIIGAIVGAIYLLIAILYREIKALSDDLPSIIDKLEVQLSDLSDRLQDFAATLPEGLQNVINNFVNGINNSFSNVMSDKDAISFDLLGDITGNIAEGFLIVIITILSAYFFIVKRDELVANLNKNMPNSINTGWHIIYDNFKSAVGGYFKAQFKIMLVLSAIMFIGFEIMNVGYSFLLALGIAFLDLLPVFGTGAILWPWALVDMLMGNYIRAIGLVVIYLICQVLKQILQPKMVGDSIGISPLTTLVFMFIGYRFYSVLGMILGIPVGMVLVNLYRIGAFDRIVKGFQIIVHDINEFRKF